MQGKVLILGATGHIGRHSVTAFTSAGWCVRCYDRNTDNMAEAAAGADVIVNGLNPPNYKNWETEIPGFTQQVIDAAAASGATVIVPGNVYNFANVDGVFSERTPHSAQTRKGRVRTLMEQQYRQAVTRGVNTVVLRAGSFIDPDGNRDVMGMIHMRGIDKRKLTQIGGTDTRHAYCYLPDWARAAVALAEKRTELESFEDVPFPGHHFTVNELKTEVERSTGQSFTIDDFPWPVLRLLSPLWNLAYEMLEMRGLWETSHRLCSNRFNELLPQFRAANLNTVMCCSLPPELALKSA